MSGSERYGSLRVTSPGANIQVLDAYLRPVSDARGVGIVDAKLPPGAYTVVGDIEGASVSRDLLVRPGSTSELELAVHLAPAAPVYRLPTANETHGLLAHELSRPRPKPDGGALVIVLRGLAGRQMAPLKQSPTITDWHGTPVALPPSTFDPHHPPRQASRAVGWRVDLEPGVYRVRWDRTGVQPAEHTVWVAKGYKTLLFVPQGQAGPDVAGMSLHLLERARAYDDINPRAETVELALSILRTGAPARSLESAHRMLGVRTPLTAQLFAATAVALHPAATPDDRIGARLAETVRRLHDKLGDMPDVLALGRAVPGSGVAGTADVPPMLSACMDLLLTADRDDPDVIPAGSAVEMASGERYASQPWLLWKPLELEGLLSAREARQQWAVEPPRYRPVGARGGQEGLAGAGDRGGDFGGLGGVIGGLEMLPRGPSLPSEPVSPTAMRRVQEVVEESAPRLELSGRAAADALGADEIAHRLHMPQALVERTLDHLYS